MWNDNHLHSPNRPSISLVQHPIISRDYAKGWFALVQFGQILLHGKECYSHCSEPPRSSASVGGCFKGKAVLILRCSQSYFHAGFISTGSALQDYIGTRYMNKAFAVSVVSGKPVKQKYFLLPTFFPKFQWKPEINFPLFEIFSFVLFLVCIHCHSFYCL